METKLHHILMWSNSFSPFVPAMSSNARTFSNSNLDGNETTDRFVSKRVRAGPFMIDDMRSGSTKKQNINEKAASPSIKPIVKSSKTSTNRTGSLPLFRGSLPVAPDWTDEMSIQMIDHLESKQSWEKMKEFSSTRSKPQCMIELRTSLVKYKARTGHIWDCVKSKSLLGAYHSTHGNWRAIASTLGETVNDCKMQYYYLTAEPQSKREREIYQRKQEMKLVQERYAALQAEEVAISVSTAVGTKLPQPTTSVTRENLTEKLTAHFSNLFRKSPVVVPTTVPSIVSNSSSSGSSVSNNGAKPKPPVPLKFLPKVIRLQQMTQQASLEQQQAQQTVASNAAHADQEPESATKDSAVEVTTMVEDGLQQESIAVVEEENYNPDEYDNGDVGDLGCDHFDETANFDKNDDNIENANGYCTPENCCSSSSSNEETQIVTPSLLYNENQTNDRESSAQSTSRDVLAVTIVSPFDHHKELPPTHSPSVHQSAPVQPSAQPLPTMLEPVSVVKPRLGTVPPPITPVVQVLSRSMDVECIADALTADTHMFSSSPSVKVSPYSESDVQKSNVAVEQVAPAQPAISNRSTTENEISALKTAISLSESALHSITTQLQQYQHQQKASQLAPQSLLTVLHSAPLEASHSNKPNCEGAHSSHNDNNSNSNNSNVCDVINRIAAIYRQYNPDGVNDLPALLHTYEGDEATLLTIVETMYCTQDCMVTDIGTSSATTSAINNIATVNIPYTMNTNAHSAGIAAKVTNYRTAPLSGRPKTKTSNLASSQGRRLVKKFTTSTADNINSNCNSNNNMNNMCNSNYNNNINNNNSNNSSNDTLVAAEAMCSLLSTPALPAPLVIVPKISTAYLVQRYERQQQQQQQPHQYPQQQQQYQQKQQQHQPQRQQYQQKQQQQYQYQQKQQKQQQQYQQQRQPYQQKQCQLYQQQYLQRKQQQQQQQQFLLQQQLPVPITELPCTEQYVVLPMKAQPIASRNTSLYSNPQRPPKIPQKIPKPSPPPVHKPQSLSGPPLFTSRDLKPITPATAVLINEITNGTPNNSGRTVLGETNHNSRESPAEHN